MTALESAQQFYAMNFQNCVSDVRVGLDAEGLGEAIALAFDVAMRLPPQFVINNRQKRIQRLTIAVVPLLKHCRYVLCCKNRLRHIS